ncbi:RNA pyrophosphohydrolase [compost metagenome]
MPMSEYYNNLREKIGSDLLFIPSVAAIIRNEENEILFVRKNNERIWGLPAGAIEMGETPAESVTREVYEETGLIIRAEKILGVFGGEKYRYEYSNGHQVEYLTIVFECKIVDGTLNGLDGEIEKVRFYWEDEIPEIAIPYSKELFIKDLNTHKIIFE